MLDAQTALRLSRSSKTPLHLILSIVSPTETASSALVCGNPHNAASPVTATHNLVSPKLATSTSDSLLVE